MKEIESTRYQFLPEVFLRAPYYSFSGYDISRLAEALQDQSFRNAVFLASQEFYRVMEKKSFDFDMLTPKEKHSLNKYYNRMCFRPTPFGSFASFSLINWGKGEQVKLAGKNESVLHLLPDWELMCQLNTPDKASASQPLIVNPTLYRFNDAFRYTKSSIDEKGRFNFSLDGIEAVKFNVRLFAFLTSKRPDREALNKWIMKSGACFSEDAQDYIQFLLDSGAIFSETQGSIIAGDQTGDWLKISGWREFWKQNGSIALSKEISLAVAARKMNTFLNEIQPEISQPFYAALERPAKDGLLDSGHQTELSAALRVLQILSTPAQPSNLTRFIRDFRSRFDEEKVLLLIALDPDAGLPYGEMEPAMPVQGLLDDIPFPEAESESKSLAWHTAQQYIFKLWVGDTLRDPWSPLEIHEEDVLKLEELKNAERRLPQTQALMFRSTGEHLILENSGGVTACSLIGRFSVFSGEVHRFCQQLAQIEISANPEVTFADIAQLSDTHVDNINRRRSIYPKEIPINVCSSQPLEHQILPTDLTIHLQGDELILESISLKSRVIPRLTTAYNFHNNHLPIFRLLCDLQFQGLQAGIAFSLESYFPALSFYPRVYCGKVILSLAKWIFNEQEIKTLSDKNSSEMLKSLEDFRKKHHLPRLISMGATDQQLVFDLAIASEARFFLQCIQGAKKVTIQEYLLPDRSVLAGQKPLAGQMIAFLAHEENIYKPAKKVFDSKSNPKDRNFLMGSDWLYLKIFCIPRAADELLVKVIFPFIKSQNKKIKKWFFIRYSERGYHIRLRLQADENDLGSLLVALREKIQSQGHDKLIKDFQGDTYRREIERYRPELIEEVEELFCAGSNLAASVLTLRRNDSNQLSEFELATITAHEMISCFFSTQASSFEYIAKVTGQFMKEFKAEKSLRIALDEKYRAIKNRLAEVIKIHGGSKMFNPITKQMLVLNKLTEYDSSEQKSTLLADLVHMQLNRSFLVRQRQQELLVYYCLQKYLASQMARGESPV